MLFFKLVIKYAKDNLKEQKRIDIHFLNNIHKILLDSVRGNNKETGKIRNIQNWIGPKGCIMEEAISSILKFVSSFELVEV